MTLDGRRLSASPRADRAASGLMALPAKRRGGRLLIQLALLTLPALAAATLLWLTAIAVYRAATETRLMSTAQSLAAAVDTEFAVYETAMLTLAASPAAPDGAAFARHAERLGAGIRGWFVLTEPLDEPRAVEGGAIVVDRQIFNTRAPDPLAGSEFAVSPSAASMLMEAYRNAAADPRFVALDLFKGPVEGSSVMTYMLPLQPASNGVRRFLFYATSAAGFRRILTSLDVGPQGFTAIADGGFRLVAHSDPTVPVGAQVPAWVPAAVAGRTEGVVVGPGLGKQRNLYAFVRPQRAPGWTVVVAQPVSAVITPLSRLPWAVFGGILAIALGGMAILRREQRANATEAEAIAEGRRQIERFHNAMPAILYIVAVGPGDDRELMYLQGDVRLVTDGTFDRVDRTEWDARCHPERIPPQVLYLEAIEKGEASDEYRFSRDDGSWAWLRVSTFRFSPHPDGRPQIIGYITNISARREADAKSLSASRLASIGELANSVAHELKQPLATVSIAAQNGLVALRRNEWDDVDRRISTIERHTTRALDLVEYLRRFSSVGEMKSEAGVIRVRTAVNGALALFGGALAEVGIDVVVDLGEAPPQVRGGEMILVQVLLALLANAREAIVTQPPDDRPRRIEISGRPAPNGDLPVYKLTVRGTSGGVLPPPEPRPFEPFNTTHTPDMNASIGLDVAQTMLEGCGARMSARKVGSGLEFEVLLQLAPGEQMQAD